MATLVTLKDPRSPAAEAYRVLRTNILFSALEKPIQTLIVTRVPVLIGRGIPLFGPAEQDIRLDHVRTRAFASGLVQSEYAVSQRGRTRAV